jgi:WD40 repeat protein
LLIVGLIAVVTAGSQAPGNKDEPKWQDPPPAIPDADRLPEGAVARLGRVGGWTNTLSVSPDGRFVVTAEAGQSYLGVPYPMRLWDAQTGKHLRVLEGAKGPILTAVFSPDGKTLAGGGMDNVLRFWDTESAKLTAEYPEKHHIYAVAFTPDGKRLLAGSNGLKLWDLARGKALYSFEPADQKPNMHQFCFQVALSPDGTTVATGNMDQDLRIWEVASARELGRVPLRYGVGAGHFLAYTADGSGLISTSKGKLAVFSRTTNQQVRELNGPSALSHVALSPDGQWYACDDANYNATLGRVVHIRELATGAVKGTVKTSSIAALAFSADSKELFVAGGTGALQVFSVPDGKLQRTLAERPAPILAMRLADKDRLINVVTAEPDWRVWQIEGKRELRRAPIPLPAGERAVTASADGHILMTVDERRAIRLRAAGSGRLLKECGAVYFAMNPADAVAVSADGKRAAWPVRDQNSNKTSLLAWDLEAERELWSVPAGDLVDCVVFSANGRQLYTASSMKLGNAAKEPTLRIWDAANGKAVGDITLDDAAGGKDGGGVTRRTLGVVPSPDGKTLAILEEETRQWMGGPGPGREEVALMPELPPPPPRPQPVFRIRIWDLQAKKELHGGFQAGAAGGEGVPLPPGDHQYQTWPWRPPVAFSPDSKKLAFARMYAGIVLGDVNTGELRETGGQFVQRVHALAFTGDGRTLISAGNDGTMLLWDVAKFVMSK